MPKVTVVPPQVRYRFEAECKRHGMTADSAMRAYNRGMEREARQLKRDRGGRQLHTLQWALSYVTEGREHSDVDARKRVMLWTGRGERSAIAWVKGNKPTPDYAVMLILEGLADTIENDTTQDHPLFDHLSDAFLTGIRMAGAEPRELPTYYEDHRDFHFHNSDLLSVIGLSPNYEDEVAGVDFQLVCGGERETFREAYRDAFELLIMGAYPYEDEDDDRLRAYYFLARASARRLKALVAFLDAMDHGAVPTFERKWDPLSQDKGLWEARAITAATEDLEELKRRVDSRHPDRMGDVDRW